MKCCDGNCICEYYRFEFGPNIQVDLPKIALLGIMPADIATNSRVDKIEVFLLEFIPTRVLIIPRPGETPGIDEVFSICNEVFKFLPITFSPSIVKVDPKSRWIGPGNSQNRNFDIGTNYKFDTSI